jgi:DNA-binding NarL/FixJ family response regulator
MNERSIFLAESEKHVREALRLILEHHAGFMVIGEANHAESLLAQVCQHPPDVILLDWNLPGLHHQRLTAVLRKHCPTTRILATSVRPEHAKTAFEFGVDAFLLKQLLPDQFLTKLEEALR